MKKGMKCLKRLGVSTGSARYTLRVMEQAQATIFVFNPTGKHPLLKRDTVYCYMGVVDIQSVSAAIQNMLLTAVDIGLETL